VGIVCFVSAGAIFRNPYYPALPKPEIFFLMSRFRLGLPGFVGIRLLLERPYATLEKQQRVLERRPAAEPAGLSAARWNGGAQRLIQFGIIRIGISARVPEGPGCLHPGTRRYHRRLYKFPLRGLLNARCAADSMQFPCKAAASGGGNTAIDDRGFAGKVSCQNRVPHPCEDASRTSVWRACVIAR
jgi:hypothetical protein